MRYGVRHFLLSIIEYHTPFTKLGRWALSKIQEIEIKKIKKRVKHGKPCKTGLYIDKL